MKSFLKILLLPLLALAACKKDNHSYSTLSISGLGSVAFASGDAITIYGSGFDTIPGNNIVTFSGVAGEVAAATPDQLQVIVPLLVDAGKITIRTHGQSAVSAQTYNIVNVLQGTYTDNLTLTADKKYLLRGSVIFNSKLIIEPGTVIYGEKLTHGGLTVYNADFQGTADKPIVFTSDQAPGSRSPGDWVGISCTYDPQASGPIPPVGIVEYVRVEYAGFHQPGVHGQAINLGIDGASVFKYLQASYSAGDGITMLGVPQALNMYIEHIIALACGGDDFRVYAAVTAQYGLAIKDPYYADPLQGNGINFPTTASCVLSNFTIIGYNPAARNISSPPNVPLTWNAGRGVSISGGPTAVYNSVIAANWLAGASLWCGQGTTSVNPYNNWTNFEDSLPDPNAKEITLRNNYFVAVAPPALPVRGGMFGLENFYSWDGFESTAGSTQLGLFGTYNDTTRALDLTQGKDDLGLSGLADYKNLNHPVVLPPASSRLLSGARFQPLTPANNPLLNKDITYIGAFGTQDWTLGWANFNPQQTSY
jgi:hypothetical protein